MPEEDWRQIEPVFPRLGAVCDREEDELNSSENKKDAAPQEAAARPNVAPFSPIPGQKRFFFTPTHPSYLFRVIFRKVVMQSSSEG